MIDSKKIVIHNRIAENFNQYSKNMSLFATLNKSLLELNSFLINVRSLRESAVFTNLVYQFQFDTAKELDVFQERRKKVAALLSKTKAFSFKLILNQDENTLYYDEGPADEINALPSNSEKQIKPESFDGNKKEETPRDPAETSVLMRAKSHPEIKGILKKHQQSMFYKDKKILSFERGMTSPDLMSTDRFNRDLKEQPQKLNEKRTQQFSM